VIGPLTLMAPMSKAGRGWKSPSFSGKVLEEDRLYLGRFFVKVAGPAPTSNLAGPLRSGATLPPLKTVGGRTNCAIFQLWVGLFTGGGGGYRGYNAQRAPASFTLAFSASSMAVDGEKGNCREPSNLVGHLAVTFGGPALINWSSSGADVFSSLKKPRSSADEIGRKEKARS